MYTLRSALAAQSSEPRIKHLPETGSPHDSLSPQDEDFGDTELRFPSVARHVSAIEKRTTERASHSTIAYVTQKQCSSIPTWSSHTQIHAISLIQRSRRPSPLNLTRTNGFTQESASELKRQIRHFRSSHCSIIVQIPRLIIDSLPATPTTPFIMVNMDKLKEKVKKKAKSAMEKGKDAVTPDVLKTSPKKPDESGKEDKLDALTRQNTTRNRGRAKSVSDFLNDPGEGSSRRLSDVKRQQRQRPRAVSFKGDFAGQPGQSDDVPQSSEAVESEEESEGSEATMERVQSGEESGGSPSTVKRVQSGDEPESFQDVSSSRKKGKEREGSQGSSSQKSGNVEVRRAIIPPDPNLLSLLFKPSGFAKAFPVNDCMRYCFRKHAKLHLSSNKNAPVECAACHKDDEGYHYSCSWCCLRMCQSCRGQFDSNGLDALLELITISGAERERERKQEVKACTSETNEQQADGGSESTQDVRAEDDHLEVVNGSSSGNNVEHHCVQNAVRRIENSCDDQNQL